MTVSLEAEQPRRGGGAEGARGASRLGLPSSRFMLPLALTAAVSFACGGIDLTGECGALTAEEVNVVTWWDGDSLPGDTSAAEAKAQQVLEQQFLECNPEASVRSSPYPDKQSLLNDLPRHVRTRASPDPTQGIAGGASAEHDEPWDVVLLNAGSDVALFSGCSGMNRDTATSSRLIPLSEIVQGDLLDRPFPQELMQAVRCDGEYYAAPVGVHRLNSLYFNRRLLESAGCRQQDLQNATADEFAAIVQELDSVLVRGQAPDPALATCVSQRPASRGVESIFAIATGEPWAVSLFVFENLMVSTIGIDGYERFWRGHRGDPEGQHDLSELRHTLGALQVYASYLTPLDASGAPGWEERGVQWAFRQVREGQAVFTVMGDWQSPDSVDQLMGEVAFPGTQDGYVYTADVFAVPVGAPHLGGARAWLRAVTSRRAQERYIPVKGGASAREDTWRLPPGVRSAPGLPLLIPTNAFDDLKTKLRDWLEQMSAGTRNDQFLLDYVLQEYCKLSEAAEFCYEPDRPR